MKTRLHYFRSPIEIIAGLNDALGRYEYKYNLLVPSEIETRRRASVFERFFEIARNLVGASIDEVTVRKEFNLLEPTGIAIFNWGKGLKKRGRLFVEQGYVEGGNNIYEKIHFSGGEEISNRGEIPAPFDISFYGVQNPEQDSIFRMEQAKGAQALNFLKENFPNECFVQPKYLDVVRSG